MQRLEIREIVDGNLDDAISLCVPPERRADPLFAEGAKTKKE
jgi:hypothetical protein